jgi:hypothetical protein
MGSLAIVVIDVLAENQLQVAFADDKQPVQELEVQSLDHPIAVGDHTALGYS